MDRGHRLGRRRRNGDDDSSAGLRCSGYYATILALRSDFIVPALDCLEHVAWFGYTRPVNLRLRFALHFMRARRHTAASALKVDTHALRFICLKRTGVSLLFRNANIRENVQN